MFGIKIKNKRVPYVSMNKFMDIEKLNYFENVYFPKQFDVFCNDIEEIVKDYQDALISYELYLNDEEYTMVDVFNSSMTTYGSNREPGWEVIKTYLPEYLDYLFEDVFEHIYDIFIQYERKGNNVPFHRDWAPDGCDEDDFISMPSEDEWDSSGAAWIWLRFSDSKKLYVSELEGRDDVSKRIPLDAYGAIFNGRDFHGCYDDSYGYSSRMTGTLKYEVVNGCELDVSKWEGIYPPSQDTINQRSLRLKN